MNPYDYVKCQICGVNFDDHSSVSPDCAGRKPAPEPEPHQTNGFAGHSVNPNFPAPSSLNAHEPPSQDSGNPACWDAAIRGFRTRHKGETYCNRLIDIFRERNEIGIKKYGIPVMINNGRDPLVDVFQEFLDSYVYMAQAIMEASDACLIKELKKIYVSIEESIVKTYLILESQGKAL